MVTRIGYHLKIKHNGMKYSEYEAMIPYDNTLIEDFKLAQYNNPHLTELTIDDVVQCKLCNEFISRVSGQHLKKHGIYQTEYELKFPGAPLVSRNMRRSFSTNNVEYWVKKHGVVQGPIEYEKYKTMLAEKNKLKFKQDRHGWTETEFNEFNKKRAQTKDNMIKRYGQTEGLERWLSYVETQKIAGSSLEWFVAKHGEEEGKKVWDEINLKKITCNDQMVSKAEIIFYTELLDRTSLKNYHVMHGDDQFYISGSKFYLYDVVVNDPFKLCIEFHGDYWHCNPKKYKPDYYHSQMRMTSQEVWDKDKVKQNVIETQGYKYHVVWETDWSKNKDQCISEIEEIIQQLILEQS